MMRPRLINQPWNTTAALLGVLAWGTAAAVSACDTPVYRYAMYRWEPAPYEVYYFFDQEEQKAELDPVVRAIEARYADDVEPANVALFPVDLAEDPELQTLPPDVRRIWQAKEKAAAPSCLIVNPQGGEVFHGAFDEASVQPLIESPLRRKIGQALQQGHAGVCLLVPGADQALNKAAAEALEKLVADVNSGKLELYTAPAPFNEGPAGPPARENAKPALSEEEQSRDGQREEETPDEDSTDEEPTDAEAEDASAEPTDDGQETDGNAAAAEQGDEPSDAQSDSPPHTIASLTLTPEAAKRDELWLYRSLLAVEDDLHEFVDEPMLFVVYGRGRVLPPYIGKGITYDNLAECTEFITGACSCTVKDQNPGVDLLVQYDWEAASAAVAEKFGVEEGNEGRLADLFPQLIAPAAAAEVASADPAAEPSDNPGDIAPEDPTEETHLDAQAPTPKPDSDDEGRRSGTDPAPEVEVDSVDRAAEPASDPTTAATEDTDPAADDGATTGAAGSDEVEPAEADASDTAATTERRTASASLPGQRTPAQLASDISGIGLRAVLGVAVLVGAIVLAAATFLILKPQ